MRKALLTAVVVMTGFFTLTMPSPSASAAGRPVGQDRGKVTRVVYRWHAHHHHWHHRSMHHGHWRYWN
jgi:hypothetical protein